MRLLPLALAVLLVTASQSAPPPRVVGLWVWHYPWTSAPPQIVEDSGPQWHSSALLVNFCDGGRLRMATGVLYRDTDLASLGSSDGLMLYEGEWEMDGEAIKATYRLVDSEIKFTGMELAMRTKQVEHLRVAAGELLFSFRHPGATTAPTLHLNSVVTATPRVEDRFVECSAKAPHEPTNKSPELTRKR